MLKMTRFFLDHTKTLRRWFRWWDRFITRHKYPVYLGFIMLVTVGCLLKSPYHVLSQNFIYLIQIGSMVLAVELGFLSSRKVNFSQNTPRYVLLLQDTAAAMRKDIAFLCALVGIPYLTIMLSSYFIKQCQVLDGSIAFWVSVVPSFLAGLVWGYSVGFFTKKWRFFWLFTIAGFVLLSAYEGANAYFGYQWNFHYLLLGDVPFQRNTVLPSGFQVYSRVMLLAATIVLHEWATVLYVLKRARRQVGLLRVGRTVLLTIAVFVVGYLTQGETGLGWSYRRINRFLSQQIQIENVRLHYHPGHRIEPYVWRKVQWDIYKLAQRMQVNPDPDDVVEVYVFPSHADIKTYANASSAYAKFGKFFMSEWSLRGSTFAHELAHVYHHHLYNPSWKLYLRRALIEGTAMAFTEGLTLSPEHHENMAILEQEGTLPSIEEFYKDLLFIKNPESLSYDACGSFVGFLILEYGVETYKTFNTSMNFKKVYGFSLKELNEQWKAFLRAVPVDYVRKKNVSAWCAGQTAYTARCCPQVRGRQESRIPGDQHLSWWLDPVGAQALYAESREREPDNPEWLLKYITALIANNEETAANNELEAILAEAQEKDDEAPQGEAPQDEARHSDASHHSDAVKYDAYRLQFFQHALNQNLDGAVTALQQMLAISEDPENWQALRLQLLQHPSIGPVYLQAILVDWKDRENRLATLHYLDPEFGPAYGYAFYFTNAYPDVTTKHRFLKEFINRTEGFSPLKSQAYKSFLNECIKYQYYDEAGQALAYVDVLELSNKDRADIIEIRDRLRFEKKHFSEKETFLPHNPSHLTDTWRINRVW